jgi:pimeloyl-ACP methyl ester carboxylesterase
MHPSLSSTLPKHEIITCGKPDTESAFGAGFHRLHYLEWGDISCKNTVVCVHGLTRNAHDFDMLACELVKHDYRVICPDIVGRGDSDWLYVKEMYGYPQYVADISSLLMQLGLSHVYWVGTSMGGLIGMLLEAMNPMTIDKMVINDIGPYIPKSALKRLAEYVGQNMAFASKEKALVHFKQTFEGFGLKEDWQWNLMLRHSVVQKDDGLWHMKYDPAIAMAFRNKRGKIRWMRDVKLWNYWDMLHTPTLVLRGSESDLLDQKTADRMAKREGVSVHEFAGVGHAPSLMEEAQIDVVVNWLNAEQGVE